MTEQESYSLGQLYKELSLAVYGSRGPNAAEMQNALIFPWRGVSMLITKAHALHKVSPRLDRQIMYILSDLPADFSEDEYTTPCSMELQGAFQLGFCHGLPDVTPPNVGVQAARNALGWKARELADKMGVTLRQVQRWESGESRPSVADAQRLADVLGTSVAALFPPAESGSK